MLEDWPDECRSIVQQLQTDDRSVLRSNGAILYPVNISGQVRIGWPKGTGILHVPMAIIDCRSPDCIKLTLRVGRHSGLIGDSRSLQPVYLCNESDRDWGHIELCSTPIVDDVFQWLTQASKFTRSTYNL